MRRHTLTILLYGLLLGGVMAGFKLLEYSYFARRLDVDLYIGIVALLFLTVGFVVGMKRSRQVSSSSLNDTLSESESEIESGSIDRIRSLSTVTTVTTFSTPETRIETELSEREQEVLGLVAEGKTNREIAERLFLSPNTVKTHVSNIFRKLDVERRAHAVARAKELHLID